MTSTNHFRHRRLSRSIRSPVSPRPHPPKHIPAPPPVFGYFADWDFHLNSGGRIATVNPRSDSLTRLSDTLWLVSVVSTEGKPCDMYSTWNPALNRLWMNLNIDWGSGVEYGGQFLASTYAGVEPFTSPSLVFSPAGGVTVISSDCVISLPVVWHAM